MKARVLKGTQAQVLAYLDDHEIGFCTDTKAVFIKDSTSKRFVGSAAIGATSAKPDAGHAGRFYYDTTLGALFLDNGSEWVNASVEGSSFVHASAHITGAADEIDGDKLDVDWDPTNYTPATVENFSTSADNLTSHLKGIDTAVGGKAASDHDHAKADITDFGSYQAPLTGTSSLADLGISAIDPAFSGTLTGITTASTLLQVLTAIDGHTHT